MLVSDAAAFVQRYGGGINILGTYAGNLSNSGEQIKLEDHTNSTIAQFTFEDGTGIGEEDWTTAPDGNGPSLVVIDTQGDYDDGTNWRASTTTHGTPGSGEAANIIGDVNGDGFVGAADLDQILATWGDSAASSSAATQADLDNSGTVGSGDLSIVINNFGNGTPPNQPTSNNNTNTNSNTRPNRPGNNDDNNTNTRPARPTNTPPTNTRPARPINTQPTRPTNPRPTRPINTQPTVPSNTRPAQNASASLPTTPPPARDTAPLATPLTPNQQRAANTRPQDALALAKPLDPTPAQEKSKRPPAQAPTQPNTRPRFDALKLR